MSIKTTFEVKRTTRDDEQYAWMQPAWAVYEVTPTPPGTTRMATTVALTYTEADARRIAAALDQVNQVDEHARDGDHDLMDYEDGSVIRPASAAEHLASRAAARRDGGRGVIEVTIKDSKTSCYVL